MKRSKFSEQQIAFILRQAEEGTSVDEVCRKAGLVECNPVVTTWRPTQRGARSASARKQSREQSTDPMTPVNCRSILAVLSA